MSQISNAKMAAKKLKHRQKQRRAKKAMVKRSISTPGWGGVGGWGESLRECEKQIVCAWQRAYTKNFN